MKKMKDKQLKNQEFTHRFKVSKSFLAALTAGISSSSNLSNGDFDRKLVISNSLAANM